MLQTISSINSLPMMYNLQMRTTVTLDDETAAIAAQYARSRDVSLSKAIAELIVRGTRRSPRIKYEGELPVFDLPKSTRTITTAHVKSLESDES